MSTARDNGVSDPKERLRLLESRRLAFDSSMWQVPTLTFAVQAFLLQVLTNEKVGWWVAIPVATAGILASLAAGLSLRHLRENERLHSEEVKALAVANGLGDPNLPRRRRLRAYWLWLATLVAFIAADVVALIASR